MDKQIAICMKFIRKISDNQIPNPKFILEFKTNLL